MFEQVIVAIDGSATSNRGLKAAIGLAAVQHAALAIVHVDDDRASMSHGGDMSYVPANFVDRLLEDLRANGRRILERAEAAANEAGVNARTLLVEAKGQTVAEAILAQARKLRADVIVLGTHGRRGLRRALMGSDAETVLREARIPVLLVRTPERSATPKSASAPYKGSRRPKAEAAQAETRPRSRKRGP
jgi:nucleotide-binding universal stress UspA family protein